MAETIFLRGEGGGIHAMDLPLPEPIEERMRKGMLVRVNDDGSPYVAPEPEPEPADDPGASGAGSGTKENEDGAKGDGRVPEPGQQVPGPPLAEPAKNASHADWVGWAVVQGADAEEADGMTRGDLIEKYAAKT